MDGNTTVFTNAIDYNLIENINTILEKNIQAKEAQDEEALSKKSDQGIDSAQEKLPATDIGLEEKQGSSKGMQQLQEVVQEQKSEQQEWVNAALSQIVNKQIMHGDMLESMTKQLQQLGLAIGEIKLLLKELSSIPVGQTQLTENNLGTESIGEHSQLLLGVVNLETDI
ncbi:MAG: hypothetical protein LN568_01905 [Rickettsia endosymbiont of Pseudomimeciton antennatum]|nr:hypothetical protein [Rickettsia endosymbiont of Pseudomimeciton antennatum]